MILAIDLDQVVHDKLHPIPGRRMGPPFPDARGAIIRLKRQKHTVIIHTTMARTPSGMKAVADWLTYYKIPYDSIEGKIAADVYLDDKALHHTDWTTTMRELQKKVR